MQLNRRFMWRLANVCYAIAIFTLNVTFADLFDALRINKLLTLLRHHVYNCFEVEAWKLSPF